MFKTDFRKIFFKKGDVKIIRILGGQCLMGAQSDLKIRGTRPHGGTRLRRRD